MSNSWNRAFGVIATIATCLVLCIVIVLWVWLDRTIGERRRLNSQIHASIESLATKCPPDLTQNQWNVALYWTLNMSGNTALTHAKLDELRRFQRELEERAKGKVDMELIFWIWDEVAKISPTGTRYKENFQKHMLDEMQPSSAKSYFWGGDSVFGVRHDLISQIYLTIMSLASKRPPEVTQTQWNLAINRTTGLPSDRLLSGRVKVDDLRRFQRELEEKAKGNVDMELIFWIWDEYAKLSPATQEYKENHQKVMLDQMQWNETPDGGEPRLRSSARSEHARAGAAQ